MTPTPAIPAEWLVIGAGHVPSRLSPPALHRDILKSEVSLPMQDWTNPFGRGYIYEFYLDATQLRSLVVLISALVPCACVYFAYRDGTPPDHVDTLLDEPIEIGNINRESQLDAQSRIIQVLQRLGYRLMAYRALSVKKSENHNTTLLEMLFDNPED